VSAAPTGSGAPTDQVVPSPLATVIHRFSARTLQSACTAITVPAPPAQKFFAAFFQKSRVFFF
jgi:hypothetical protein